MSSTAKHWDDVREAEVKEEDPVIATDPNWGPEQPKHQEHPLHGTGKHGKHHHNGTTPLKMFANPHVTPTSSAQMFPDTWQAHKTITMVIALQETDEVNREGKQYALDSMAHLSHIRRSAPQKKSLRKTIRTNTVTSTTPPATHKEMIHIQTSTNRQIRISAIDNPGMQSNLLSVHDIAEKWGEVRFTHQPGSSTRHKHKPTAGFRKGSVPMRHVLRTTTAREKQQPGHRNPPTKARKKAMPPNPKQKTIRSKKADGQTQATLHTSTWKSGTNRKQSPARSA